MGFKAGQFGYKVHVFIPLLYCPSLPYNDSQAANQPWEHYASGQVLATKAGSEIPIEEETKKKITIKYMKRSSNSSVIREKQIKTMRYHFKFHKLAKVRKLKNATCWRGQGVLGPFDRLVQPL